VFRSQITTELRETVATPGAETSMQQFFAVTNRPNPDPRTHQEPLNAWEIRVRPMCSTEGVT
jgi:hypothetical protein